MHITRRVCGGGIGLRNVRDTVQRNVEEAVYFEPSTEVI